MFGSFRFIFWSSIKHFEKFCFDFDGRFGVESAPAIVFLKDPGIKPVVYHGLFLLCCSAWEPFYLCSVLHLNNHAMISGLQVQLTIQCFWILWKKIKSKVSQIYGFESIDCPFLGLTTCLKSCLHFCLWFVEKGVG